MFFRKVTTRNDGKEYTYVKLIESYRQGNQVRQRVIANLGNIDDLTPFKVYALINSLARVCGVDPCPPAAKPKIKRILRYGDVIFIHKIWERLGLDRIMESLPGAEPGFSQAGEVLVIAELLRLPFSVIRDWPRHLYLPAPPRQEKQFAPEDVFSFLGKNAEPLREAVLSRLKERGELKPPFYHFLIQGSLRKNVQLPPLLKEAGGRQAFTAAVTLNQSGVPLFLREFATEQKEAPRFFECKKVGLTGLLPLQTVFVEDCLAFSENNQPAFLPFAAEYITSLSPGTPEFKELKGRFLLDRPPDDYDRLPPDENILYKEVPAQKGRYIICRSTADSSAAAILKTNAKNISTPTIIRAYEESAALRRRFRLDDDIFSGCADYRSETETKGRLLVLWLALLIEKTGEQILKAAAVNLSASAALQILEPVKIAVLETGGEVIFRTVALDKTQRRILSVLDEEAERSRNEGFVAG